ncbi:MAG: hypothetical protein LIO87_09575 [Eubacterium sp.]|nr:hypothetical protein [Eubacterium sp.]MCC8173911.1 hypothetical protein [Odoribacter sp.]
MPIKRINNPDEAKKSEQADSNNSSDVKIQAMAKIPAEGYDDVANDTEKFVEHMYEKGVLGGKCSPEFVKLLQQDYIDLSASKKASVTNKMNTSELTKDESEVQFKETTAAPVQAQSETEDLNSDFTLQSSAPQVDAASLPTQPETNYINPDFTSQNQATKIGGVPVPIPPETDYVNSKLSFLSFKKQPTAILF